jgi:hypothetical protein
MTDPQVQQVFLRLSSILTGVEVSSFRPVHAAQGKPGQLPKLGDLDPRNSPAPLAPEFIALLNQWERGVPFRVLLRSFTELETEIGPRHAAKELLNDKNLGPLCRSIMKLWYLGVWYPPDDPMAASHVVSMNAYIESLAWKVMQAHPAGYSMGYFGHWAEVPPALDQFVSVGRDET